MQESELTGAKVSISQVEAGILNTLLYFDMFQYPLREEELLRVHPQVLTNPCVAKEAIGSLLAGGLIARHGDFYQVAGTPSWEERRLRGNALAAQRMQRALKRSRFVSRFPFVRAVMVSGSLSKNYMEPGSDIDFFVVVQAGRLWVARTLLILYKKVFLFNSHKEFCMNYFVDTAHLEIEDKNIFTATEVAYLLPTFDYGRYKAFREANGWAEAYYPNFGLRERDYCHEGADGPLKRMNEWLLAGRLGERLDDWCLRRTLGRWRKKFAHFTQEKFEIALRSRKYVSKHHPSHFQERVMRRLEARQAELEERFGIQLRSPEARS